MDIAHPATPNFEFEPILTPDQYRDWSTARWPALKMAIPLVASLATYSRSEFLERARDLADLPLDNDDKDGLVTMMRTTEDVIEFSGAMVEIFQAVQARLMVAADDLLIERGHASVLAAAPAFDAAEWIKRATDAGATMFVRDDELWIGAVAGAGQSDEIEKLKGELDVEERHAVRDVLASRGLVCAEAN